MSNTVLVTGADGFIGSHLTEELVKKGEKVKAFCYYNSFGTLGWIDTLPKEIRSEIEVFMGDIRDPNGVRCAMEGQDVVYHLAALIAIPFSYHSPDSYVDTNIKGTLNVLNAARQVGTKRLLVTSTSEVYGTAQYVPIDEKHPYQGQSPYSATKIGADRLAESFYRSFDLPVSIVRPFNTYGPRPGDQHRYRRGAFHRRPGQRADRPDQPQRPHRLRRRTPAPRKERGEPPAGRFHQAARHDRLGPCLYV